MPTFQLRKWEPQAFKAETQAAATAVVLAAGLAFGLDPKLTAALTVVAGYAVGFLTVKP